MHRTLSWQQMGFLVNIFAIGVGAQSILGQVIFTRKYMHEKLTKCPNFT